MNSYKYIQWPNVTVRHMHRKTYL